MSWLSAIPIVGSIVGGIQSRSAINNAEDALLKSYQEAGVIGQDALNRVNPRYTDAANLTGDAVRQSADEAATGATDAANAGIKNINDAVTSGQAGVNDAVSAGQKAVSPYVEAGASSLATLTKLLQKPDAFQFQADPGYQFRVSEGMKAINRSAAAHGAAGGGGTAKALASYNSGMASQEYGNAWSRWNETNKTRQAGLTQVAGMGERAGEFSGDLGVRGSSYNAGLGLTGANAGALLGQRAAEYGGTMRTNATQWWGSNYNTAVDKQNTNELNLANFLANLKLQGGKTIAGANLGRADVWNSVINGITGADWGGILGKKSGGKAGNGMGDEEI